MDFTIIQIAIAIVIRFSVGKCDRAALGRRPLKILLAKAALKISVVHNVVLINVGCDGKLQAIRKIRFSPGFEFFQSPPGSLQ